MFLMIIAIIILILGLLNVKKINDMFNKPTVEELENYQESVFLHVDEEIVKYKKDIKDIYEVEGKPMIQEMEALIALADERISEIKEIENRLDEKIIKINNISKILQ